MPDSEIMAKVRYLRLKRGKPVLLLRHSWTRIERNPRNEWRDERDSCFWIRKFSNLCRV